MFSYGSNPEIGRWRILLEVVHMDEFVCWQAWWWGIFENPQLYEVHDNDQAIG